VIVMEIPLRMRQTRTATDTEESQSGGNVPPPAVARLRQVPGPARDFAHLGFIQQAQQRRKGSVSFGVM
jgi:hypothetical protein